VPSGPFDKLRANGKGDRRRTRDLPYPRHSNFKPPPFVLSLSKDTDTTCHSKPKIRAGEPVSRVLSCRRYPTRGPYRHGQPFLSATCCQAAPATNPGNWRETRLHSRECVLPLFGLAPGGVCHAASVAGRAVRSCRTLSPLPGAESPVGGLLSVALSLARLVAGPAGVTRHPCFVEPGLSSASGEVMTRLPGSPVREHHLAWPRSRANSSSNSNAPICPSTSPSILCGRQRRWNAATAAALSLTS
jgi:hypothetical protein